MSMEHTDGHEACDKQRRKVEDRLTRAVARTAEAHQRIRELEELELVAEETWDREASDYTQRIDEQADQIIAFEKVHMDLRGDLIVLKSQYEDSLLDWVAMREARDEAEKDLVRRQAEFEEQTKLVDHLEYTTDNLADQTQNLIQKNDNQVKIIDDLNKRVQTQYEDIMQYTADLHEQKGNIRDWMKLTDELRAQVIDLRAKATEAEAKLEEVESHRDYLVQDKVNTLKYYKNRAGELHLTNQGLLLERAEDIAKWKTHTDELRAQVARLEDENSAVNGSLLVEVASLDSRLTDALLSYETAAKERNRLKAANLLHATENQVTTEMVARIVNAMTGAGYDIAGWGNDDQLANLEGSLDDLRSANDDLMTATNEIGDTLNEIRTER
jgi:chromosome segregation ATPase